MSRRDTGDAFGPGSHPSDGTSEAVSAADAVSIPIAGHTPGPWDCTGCLFPDDDMGGVYYRLQADGMDARAANARLIAAAPELLEALQAMWGCAGHTEECAFYGDPEGVCNCGYGPARDATKAAIAKATGAA